MTYTREELAAILEAAKKATPGPWEPCGSVVRTKRTDKGGGFFVADCYRSVQEPREYSGDGGEAHANAGLTAGAPILAAEVERQAKRIAELEAEVASPLLATAGRMAEAIADEKAMYTSLRALRDCIMNTRGPDAYRAVQEADRVLGAYEAKHSRSPAAAPGV